MIRIRQAWLTGTSFLLALLLSEALSTDVEVRGSVQMTDEDRLLEELFKRRHYNPNSRPVQSANDAVAVHLAIVPIQLNKIDDLNEVMELLVWIAMMWSDFRLAWNESEYGGLSSISVPCSKLWIPDIVLMNRADKWQKLSEVNIVVSSNGICEWFSPMMALSHCPIDIQWFPFDDQECLLEFESWSHDSSKMNLSVKSTPIRSGYYRNNSEWDLVEISYNNTVVLYHDSTISYYRPVFTFHWRRRILFYGFNLILPCTLLSALSAATFIIPPQSGERIGLGISTLLALCVNQLIVADRIPPTSDAIPLIGIYFACVMTINTLSLMAMVCISNLYHRSSTKLYPMPNWVKTYVCIRLAELLRMPRPASGKGTQIENCQEATSSNAIQLNNRKSSISSDVADDQSPDGDVIRDDGDWRYAALVIDRLCFYVCTFYLTTVTVAFCACAIAVRS